ncbi:MAG: 2OG-Fe(II) oxygenase [Roseiarcus sp.]
MLDEAALAAMEVRHDPYDYAFVDQAIPLSRRDEVLADAPVIPHRGTYGVPNLRYGPKFDAVLKDLQNPRFRKIVEKKFGVDLSKTYPTLVMMGNTTGHYNEGYAHPDSKHKIFTVLLGFTREYPYERGRLRILRSNDREDYAFEYAPEFGKMCLFRVSDKSWHGFLPQKSQRMSLQFCWVDSKSYARQTYVRHYVSAIAKATPGFNKLLEYVPRNWRKLLPWG